MAVGQFSRQMLRARMAELVVVVVVGRYAMSLANAVGIPEGSDGLQVARVGVITVGLPPVQVTGHLVEMVAVGGYSSVDRPAIIRTIGGGC